MNRLDQLLDRHHYRIIVAILALGVGGRLVPRMLSENYALIIEVAFTLDAFLAALGLGVLLHLLTRKRNGEEIEPKGI
jgi:hypothetical protein